MNFRHILIALCVVLLWGTNFTVGKYCLQGMPPFALCFWRFMLLLPLAFFVKFPLPAYRKFVFAYALVLGLFKLSLMFVSMHMGMPAGLGALIIQTQIIFTTLFAVIYLKTSLSLKQILGIVISFSGLILLAYSECGQSFPLISFILVILSAMFWGVANIILRKLSDIKPVTIIAWMPPVVLLPIFLINLFFEGGRGVLDFSNIDISGRIYGALYISYASTFLGTMGWAYLISLYSPEKVAIYAILIPLVAMVEGVFFLGETISSGAYAAGTLIIIGLYVNQSRLKKRVTNLEFPVIAKSSAP